MNFFKKENEYIVLKDGYNKPLIIGVILSVVILVFLVSTKFWMPDTRDKMTLNNQDEMIFRDTVVSVGKEYLWNEGSGVAQFTFKEYCIDQTEEKISCVVKNDEGVTMPVELIAGHPRIENEQDSSTVTDYICQFGMLKNTYYLTFEISKGEIKYNFSIDYRDFKKKNIVELDSQYLVSLEDYQNQINALQIQKENMNKELEDIQKADVKVQEEKKERVQHIQHELKKIDNEIAVCQHQIDVLNEGIKK